MISKGQQNKSMRTHTHHTAKPPMSCPTIAHITAGTYNSFTSNKSKHILVPPSPQHKHTQSPCRLVTLWPLSQQLMAWIPLSAFVLISFLHKSSFRTDYKHRGECLCHFSVTEFLDWTLPDTEPCGIISTVRYSTLPSIEPCLMLSSACCLALSHTELCLMLDPVQYWTFYNTELCLIKICSELHLILNDIHTYVWSVLPHSSIFSFQFYFWQRLH